MLVTSIFSFSPQCFLPFPKQISNFHSRLSSANAFNLEQPKNMPIGKELGLEFSKTTNKQTNKQTNKHILLNEFTCFMQIQ